MKEVDPIVVYDSIQQHHDDDWEDEHHWPPLTEVDSCKDNTTDDRDGYKQWKQRSTEFSDSDWKLKQDASKNYRSNDRQAESFWLCIFLQQ